MSKYIFKILPLVLILALLSAQKSQANEQTRSVPLAINEKQTNQKEQLSKILFALKDERDMHFAIQIVKKQSGKSTESLKKKAAQIIFADFENYIADQSRAKRLVYLGSGVFRIDALHFKLNHETFKEASFLIKLFKIQVKGKNLEVASLEKIQLGGASATDYAGFRIYTALLLKKINF